MIRQHAHVWWYLFLVCGPIVGLAATVQPVLGQQPIVRTYEVQFTETPPTMDGMVSPGEWDAAGEEGDWGVLRDPSNFEDLDETSFRALWDAEAFYLLLETEFLLWDVSPGPMPSVGNFSDNNWNIFWDPNSDGDPNVPENIDPLTMSAANQDNYQIAFSQFEGMSLMHQEDLDGNWFFSNARYQNNFANNTGWRSDLKAEPPEPGDVGLRDIVVAQNNDLDGGVAEVKIPWTEFDAVAELEIDDGMGGTMTVETGLHHPFAPGNGDTWFFQAGRISTDSSNFLPVWNWHPGQYFAEHPHGEITFVGAPDVEGIPGDYSGNGLVEQADLDLVLGNWGADASNPANIPPAWANDPPQGFVDQNELDKVLGNWGSMGPGLVGAAGVPEPAAWMLVALTAATAIVFRRRAVIHPFREHARCRTVSWPRRSAAVHPLPRRTTQVSSS